MENKQKPGSLNFRPVKGGYVWFQAWHNYEIAAYLEYRRQRQQTIEGTNH
jgi:hypothetical protein